MVCTHCCLVGSELRWVQGLWLERSEMKCKEWFISDTDTSTAGMYGIGYYKIPGDNFYCNKILLCVPYIPLNKNMVKLAPLGPG